MDQKSVALIGGVGLSPDRTVVYTIDSSRGMQAVQMKSGRVLWHCSAARWPVATTKERVIAFGNPNKANQIDVVQVDAVSGKELFRSEPIPLPSWCNTNFNFSALISTRFALWRISQNESGLKLRWYATYSPVSGVQPPPGSIAKGNSGGGIIDISLKDGSANSSRIDEAMQLPTDGYALSAIVPYTWKVADGVLRVRVDQHSLGPNSLYLEYVDHSTKPVWSVPMGSWFYERDPE